MAHGSEHRVPWIIWMGVILIGLVAWAKWGPMVALFDQPYSTVLEDRHGHLLGATVASDGQWRMPPGDSIPWRFERCLLEFEDRHFHGHHGIHAPSLVRAFLQNRRAGRVVSGGSTITMQVARLGRPGAQRTVWRKLQEIVIALRLELRADKDAILNMYAAHAPFGGNVVGLEAAAWRWYGRSPRQLGWAECATLAVLPNAPATIHPGRNRDALKAKRDRLLKRLMHNGSLDSLSWSLAVEEPLPERPVPLPRLAPHLLTTLQRSGYEGHRIATTLDVQLQERAGGILARHMAPLRANEVHNAAVLVVDVRTGAVLVHIGNAPGAGNVHSGDVDIVHARRSTGSLLKPFLHADMLQNGALMPDQLVADLPTYYPGFAPTNFDKRYRGAVSASSALSRSLNVPAVRALHAHGVDRTLRKLRSMGLHSLDRPAEHYGLSLVLGGGESSLWELTGAYASMGRILLDHPKNEGLVHPPHVLVTREADEDEARPIPLTAGAVYHTIQALQRTERPLQDAGWQHFTGSEHIAWKTGTSFGHRDAWAIGLNDHYAVGVWTGNANGEGRPGLTGTLAAAPALFEIFAALPAGRGFAPPYDALRSMAVCRISGHRAGVDCTPVDTMLVLEAAIRTPLCPYHRVILVNANGTHRTTPGPDAKAVSWFIVPPAMEHFMVEFDPQHRPLPPWENDLMVGGDPDARLEAIYPRSEAHILVPMLLDGGFGKVVMQAAHRDADAQVHWDLDGTYLGSTAEDHRLAIDLMPGRHELTLTDQRGRTRSVQFTVDRGTPTQP